MLLRAARAGYASGVNKANGARFVMFNVRALFTPPGNVLVAASHAACHARAGIKVWLPHTHFPWGCCPARLTVDGPDFPACARRPRQVKSCTSIAGAAEGALAWWERASCARHTASAQTRR